MLFSCEATVLGRTKEVFAFLTHGKDALIGTALLAGCKATIDFDSGLIDLKRK